MDALLVLLVVYAGALLLKRATRLRGEPAQICLAIGVLLPLLLTAWFASGGRPMTVLSPTPSLEAQQGWWWITLKAEASAATPISPTDGTPTVPAKRVNLIAAAFWMTSLYIVITTIIGIAADLTRRRGKPPWLAIHRALIKLPVLLIGGLVLAKVDPSTILVGTSVVVIGLGLVLRETLENLLTGLTLELEGSVRQGDWIQVGESGQIGRVYEKTWRAAKLETLNNESITIPNRFLGGECIKNLDRPQKGHARVLGIGASYEDPPIKVKDILETILIRDPDVLVKPAPVVRTVGFDDFAINYEMKFWILDYRRRNDIEDRILTRIWYAFRFYKIQIPFPIRTVQMKEKDERDNETKDAQATLALRTGYLGALPIFDRLAPKELDFLAQNSFERSYSPGEHILHRNEIGHAFHIVIEGSCQAMLPGKTAEITAGKYFGEMALLTGERRTVDVIAGPAGALVIRIDKHCMKLLLQSHPSLREDLGETEQARRADLETPATPAADQTQPLLTRVRRRAAEYLLPW